ncbi:hypothetical protein AGMMS49928_07130 [Spirochaetia bacterium]|nr:hypothetical protein AGMMS49928_07130 [Spirochaetia bacterium]
MEKSGDDVVFSRIARLTVGQLLEIPFRGSGWVFLGEQGNRRGLAYDSRRIDPEGQSFVFRAEAPGTYVLKFYRQDYIRDYLLNDYVQVIVEDAPQVSGRSGLSSNRGRVVAGPRWPSALDEAAAQDRDSRNITPLDGAVPPPPVVSSAQAPSPPPAVTPTSPVAPPPVVPPVPVPTEPPPGSSPDVFINQAREAYNAGKFADTIAVLDQFRQQFPAGSDEAWWLYGQSLEANGPQKDIRSALDYYRRIIRDYPQSKWYAEARRRISYLERYYFNIQ